MTDPLTIAVVARGIFEAIGLDELFTSDEERAKAALEAIEAELQPHMGQIEVNKIEASHRSVFVSGWRPSIGWICSIGLGLHFIALPLVDYGLAVSVSMGWIPKLPELPEMDWSELMTLTLGMLGLGLYRTYEKKEGVTK